MIKKLSVGVVALALFVCPSLTAQAQNVIGVYFDTATQEPARFGTVPGGAPFDIVVITKTNDGSTASEFVITEIREAFPTVLKTGTTKINNTNLDLGNNNVGEYLIAYQICAGAGAQEVVRISYFDIAAAITQDFFVKIRGFQPGDSQGSSFGGEPGYVDCSPASNKIVLGKEPWPGGTNIDPTKTGEPNGDGLCILNPFAVPAEVSSMGTLKSRF